MPIAARLDEIGRPAWIGLMVLGFIAWWPLGLAVLGYIIGSGRMGCGSEGRVGRWQRRMERMQARMAQRGGNGSWCGPGFWSGSSGSQNGWSSRSSGNHAFDEYRSETLRRLEDEQREFLEFLERLRQAKDRSEFDQFMAERRNPPQAPAS